MAMVFAECDGDFYKSIGDTQGCLAREAGKDPHGNPFKGCWVLRDKLHKYIDHDYSRGNLIARNDLILIDQDVVDSPIDLVP